MLMFNLRQTNMNRKKRAMHSFTTRHFRRLCCDSDGLMHRISNDLQVFFALGYLTVVRFPFLLHIRDRRTYMHEVMLKIQRGASYKSYLRVHT